MSDIFPPYSGADDSENVAQLANDAEVATTAQVPDTITQTEQQSIAVTVAVPATDEVQYTEPVAEEAQSTEPVAPEASESEENEKKDEEEDEDSGEGGEGRNIKKDAAKQLEEARLAEEVAETQPALEPILVTSKGIPFSELLDRIAKNLRIIQIFVEYCVKPIGDFIKKDTETYKNGNKGIANQTDKDRGQAM
ncbi:hypothetical protein FACS1894152_1380 [Bacilli bacterium]|nr:hypothetical protein FACS1894152_1380 [Bacilli bacterium]